MYITLLFNISLIDKITFYIISKLYNILYPITFIISEINDADHYSEGSDFNHLTK